MLLKSQSLEQCRVSNMIFDFKLLMLLVASGLLVTVKAQQDAAAAALNRASLSMFLEAQRQSPDENVVVSPVSLLTLVALLGAGASGGLIGDILRVLGAPDTNILLATYGQQSYSLAYLNPTALEMASKVYAAPGYVFTPKFSSAAYTFGADYDNLDFSNPETTAAIINNWASKKTHGLIEKPVSPSMVPPSASLVLVNAIYFKGHWDDPFRPEQNTDKYFTTNYGNPIMKPMMTKETYMKYAKVPGLGEFLEMPYKKNRFKMVLVLPDLSAGGLPALLGQLAAYPQYLLLPQGTQTKIDLILPKFEIKSNLDMNKVLEGMGLGKLFTEKINLVQGHALSVSTTVQQAFVRVNENGTEAAAFSIEVMAGASAGGPTPFHADRPFVFAIMQGEKVLFLGSVMH